MKEKQELWCHECERYVQFEIDVELNGNHVIVCPNCGHEHCRVVENGKISEARWDSRNNDSGLMNTFMITTGTTTSMVSTFDTYTMNTVTSSATTLHRYSAWLTFGTGNGYI